MIAGRGEDLLVSSQSLSFLREWPLSYISPSFSVKESVDIKI